ncbi:hypothetical protein UR08_00805 [Listeria kieliensis]|uniref:Uncharacterized protein n=1 Tax=Listeria kieliensis TaxID=1621700 RepID=A0A3D8TT23_9LIST|nr:hypothetical protein UR08_00805 [Listeria kieliensis]
MPFSLRGIAAVVNPFVSCKKKGFLFSNLVFYKRGLLSCRICFTIEKELLQLKHKSSSAFGEVEVAAITSKFFEARETPVTKTEQESCRSEMGFCDSFCWDS